MLHISKTGGTTLRQMLKSAAVTTTGDGRPIIMASHPTTMPDALGANGNNQVTFFLRHPLARFVSGFNSRLRRGAPSHNVEWRPKEEIVFRHFSTANDLAEGLSSSTLTTQDRAIAAMSALTHTRWRATDWLIGPDYLEPRLDRVLFAGFQETFAEDAEAFLAALGIDTPISVEHHHQAPPTTATELSRTAEKNLLKWYAQDVELYEWVLERRDRWRPQDARS